LRALTPLPGIVAEVARNTGSGLVDYIELLRQRMLKEHGHPILGEEYFLDHVHPTIEGYKILALELIKAMAEQGMVQYGAGWGEQAIAAVEKKVEGGIDQKTHGKALITLARTLLWAGKFDDAERLAEQALAKAGDDQEIARNIDTTLVKIYQKRGDTKRAMQLLYSTIEKYPDIAESRYILGLARLEDGPFMQLEEAAANLLLVCRWMPYDDQAFQYFGIAMAMRDRLGITYASLREALRLNPKNEAVKNALARLPQLTGNQSLNPQAPTIVLDVYPSNAPRKLMQVRRDPKGNNVPDGIVVEFYENGRLKHFLDMEQGVADGFEVTWDPEGRQLARVEYRQGKAVDSPRSAP
jgi:tetratricopeptide (TPR) repeat protein